jgi:YebC/PmpR family DNA-binding regulatory protein
VTNNRNRTASEIRHTFSKNGGNLGETGCVAWMFDRKGRLTVNLENQDKDELMLLALEAGAEDFRAEEGIGEIITEPDSLEEVRKFLSEKGLVIEEEEVTMIPQNTIQVDDLEQSIKIMKMVESLEDHDDVQNVYGNFEIPDEILAQLEN